MELSAQEIHDLVLEAQAGRADAMCRIAEHYQQKLFNFCVYLTGNRELAQDLCQDSLIKAFENIKKLREPAKFTSWLYTISRNLFISHQRTKKFTVSVDPEILNSLEDASTSPGAIEAYLDIHKILAQLKPEDRVLLILIELQGMSYSQAGEVLGISQDAVGTRLFRVKQFCIKKNEELKGTTQAKRLGS